MTTFQKAGFWPLLSSAAALACTAVPAFSSAAIAQTNEGAITYVMQRGDTLSSLDRRFLRGSSAVAEIARLNGIRNPRRIPIGTRLRIPRRLLAYREAQLTVNQFSGPVLINGQAPTQGQRIGESAQITTQAGGFISFSVPDGGSIALPSNTRAQLRRARIYEMRDLRDVDFRILNGRGSIRAPRMREEERFHTSTPSAVTAVRGTEYRVGYLDGSGSHLTEVTEGEVGVENDGFDAAVPAGLGAAVSADGTGELEELLPPVELESPGAIQTSQTVEFGFAAPEGATSARTQIARDAGFLEMLAEDVSDDGVADFGELEDGRYFVRSRGISASGLEGLSETFTFRRKRLGAEAVVETSPLADGFRFAWSPQGEGITHFAFQLWREGEAATPLYDELGLPGSATIVTGLEPGTYVWRVAAIQSDAEDGLLKVWGPEQSLTVSPE